MAADDGTAASAEQTSAEPGSCATAAVTAVTIHSSVRHPSIVGDENERIHRIATDARSRICRLARAPKPVVPNNCARRLYRMLAMRSYVLSQLVLALTSWGMGNKTEPGNFIYGTLREGGPQMVSLLLAIGELERRDESFKQRAKVIVDQSLTSMQNTCVVLSLLLGLSHLVGSKFFARSVHVAELWGYPQEASKMMLEVAFVLNALAESAAILTLSYAISVRYTLSAQLYSEEAKIEWLRESNAERTLTIGLKVCIEAFTLSFVVGAFILFPLYGFMVLGCFVPLALLSFWLRARDDHRMYELLHADVCRGAARFGNAPAGAPPT